MTFKAQRPYQHAFNARKETKHSHLFHWIRGLQAAGLEPSVLVLEELPEGASRAFVGEIEKMYIMSLHQIGHRLTNVAPGGDGGNTGVIAVHSEESRRSRAEALRKYNEDPKNQEVLADRHARQSKTKKEMWARSPEKRKALSESKKGKQIRLGAVLSDDTKKSLADGMFRYYVDPRNQDEIAERNARRAVTKANRPKVAMSAESNKARSKSLTGQKRSEEQRAGMRRAAQERERKKQQKKEQQ